MPARQPSIGSGGASSDGGSVASGASLDLGLLDGAGGDGADAADLLRGNAASKKEVLFAALHFVYKDRWLPTEWRYVVLATVLQWAQLLLLFFGPTLGWDVDWNGNSFWRFFKRLQLQNTITERGWAVYSACLYGASALVLSLLGAIIWLHFALKSHTTFRLQWPFHILRVLYCLTFTTFQTSFLLLFTVAFNCNSKILGYSMFYFPDRKCFQMPSTALFGFSIVIALVFETLSLLFSLLEMGAIDWTSGNLLSLAAGAPFYTRRIIKFLLPLVPVALKTSPRWMGWINLLLTSHYLYLTIRRVPMHRRLLNMTDGLLYSVCWWAAGLGLIGIYYPQYWPALTRAFLYGMAPIGLGCAAAVHFRLARMWRVAALFEQWTPATPRSETHAFLDEFEVEVVARVCQARERAPTKEMVPIARWVDCAERVLQAGLIQFPDSALLHILMGGFASVLRAEASGGLAHLQRARKCSDMGITERFQVYVREQEKLAQKGREADAMAVLDASSWAELTACYRQVVRTHKDALAALKSFWQMLTRSDASLPRIVKHFQLIESTRAAAERSYKTVLERYPNNPRIMRAYGRFLSQVKMDPHGASRYAASAARLEEAQGEGRREAMYLQVLERDYADEAAGHALQMIDETLDAVVLINIEGRVQYTNGAFLRLFGYRKGELEGQNVAQIMPPPFSQQHDSHLQRFASSREPRVLDSVREVVALHRQGHVFPVTLCVTALSLGGTEVFMGVIRPQEDDPGVATCYCTAGGQIVCISRGFTNILGWDGGEVIGKTFHSLCVSSERAAQVLAAVGSAKMSEEISLGSMAVMHKFGDEAQVVVSGQRAGTETVRVSVVRMVSSDRYTGLVCFSSTARVTFANQSFCEMLRHPREQLLKMKLEELMPEPFSLLYTRWLKGRDISRAQGLHCRSGRVVEWKDKHGKPVPALLDIAERMTEAGTPEFMVKVAPVKEGSSEAEWNRLSLEADAAGLVTACTGRKALFPSLASLELVGQPLDSLLDVMRKGMQEQGSVAAALASLVREACDGSANSHRVAVAVRGTRTVPAVMQVDPPAEGAEGGRVILRIYRADVLDGAVELDSTVRIKRCSDEAGLLLGVAPTAVIGCALQAFLPHVAPGGQTTELMAAAGQRGGAKRSVGPVTVVEAVHADGRPLQLSMQVVASVARPGRYCCRLICPKPASSCSVLGTWQAGTQAGGVGLDGGADAVAPRPGTGGAASACPFHRAIASSGGHGGSLLARMGLGSRAATPPAAARPQPGGACPFNPDPDSVLASLAFHPGSQFAAPGSANAVALAAQQAGVEAWEQQEAAAGVLPPAASGLAAYLRPTASSARRQQQPHHSPDHSQQPSLTSVSGAAGADHVTGEDRSQVLEPGQQQELEGEHAGPGVAATAGGATQGEETAGECSGDRSMSASEEGEGGEGGTEQEEETVDPQELAAKMALVSSWLQGGGGEAADTAAGGEAADASRLRARSATPEAGVPTQQLALAEQAARGLPAAGAGGMVVQVEKPASTADDMCSMGSEQTSLAGSEGDDAGADVSRLKRYRKANKLLSGPRARAAINALQAQLKWVLLAVVLVHAGFFAGSIILVKSSMSYIQQVDMAGVAARNAISMCADARAIQWAAMEIAEQGHAISYANPNITAAILHGKLAQLESNLEHLYFLPGRDADHRRNYFHNTKLNITKLVNVDPVHNEVELLDLWEASQRMIGAFKEIASLPPEWIFLMNEMPAWHLVLDNVPEGVSPTLNRASDVLTTMAVARLHNVVMVTWAFLATEASLVVPLAALCLYLLLRGVALERFNLFSVFLFVPRPAALALVKAKVVVDELDQESDDEDGDEKTLGDGGGVSTQVSARVMVQKATQDKFSISRAAINWLMAPFALWLAVVVICWCLQYVFISSSKQHVMTLDASERIFVYQARVKYFANELAAVGTGLDDDSAATLHLRNKLLDSATRLRFWHETVLYGSLNPLRPLENAKYNTANFTFIPTLFSDPERFDLMFRPGCVRANTSACPTPKDSLYWTNTFGLSNTIYYFAEQAELLASEAMEAITVDHPAMKHIGATATNDLAGGLARGNELLLKISNFEADEVVQAITLVFVLLGTVAYLWLHLWPYVRRTREEGRKVAELLSYLPSGVDVGALIATSIGAGGGLQGGPGSGVAVLARSSSRSSDADFS